MAKSSPAPRFRMFAGDRFTVIRLFGKENPEFFIAERIRCFDSLTAESGRPTMAKLGIPLLTSASTPTVNAEIPSTTAPILVPSRLHTLLFWCLDVVL